MTLNRALAAGFLLAGGWAMTQPPGNGAQLLALIFAVAWGYRIHRAQPAPKDYHGLRDIQEDDPGTDAIPSMGHRRTNR